MRVEFAFGKTGLMLHLPPGPQYRLLEARWAAPLADPVAAIDESLDRPSAGPALSDLARGRRTAAISVCDITRPAPNRLTLPPILRRLHAAGMRREDITILIATGLHRPATPAELDEILSPEIAARYPIVNHNARERGDHRDLGRTRSGTPVLIDERYCAAELRITLGFIEPHLMAGFSGARKLIAPGLAHQDTIRTLHSPRFMRDARAVEGSIDDNPLHQELWEISALAGHHFMVDVVLARGKKIAQVLSGTPRPAHDAGIAFVRANMLERLAEPVDAVITTAAGYPLDLTFYQTVKGVTAAQHIVKPGGIILTLAACDEGVGAPEFARMLSEAPAAEAFLEKLKDAPVTIDQWQLEKLALVTRTHQAWFYTPGLPARLHDRLWGRVFPAAAEAAETLAAALPAGATVAVIPEGPYVLARVEAPELAGAAR